MEIASRTLKYTSSSGELDIPVRIFAPVRADNGAWSCQYEIDWPNGKWTMAAWGTDSIQAILLAMQMIGSEIYTNNYHKSGKLFLDAPGKGYWFPVPTGLREMLEGDDAKYL
jgi:hypothetical protein